ncbi:hypothetical protein [Maritalea sp.]|uniref:hypothetical protein n=1 Tax=Maritalea sp. TaxID=2003361 RepID=UPI003EF4DFE9
MELDFGVLASIHPDGHPYASRIGLALANCCTPMSLISELAHHTGALQAEAKCSILLGNVASKGNPLTQARMSLICHARFLEHGTKQDAELRQSFVAQRPTSKVYAGFSDFHVVLFDVLRVDINGGFGKAYQFSARDWQDAMNS